VHGDLKPSNVLRTADGHVKLIDFGSVTASGSRPDADCTQVATPCYASPQVLAGMRAETQDDIFSLACLSYGLLSNGERPFGGKSSLEAYRARLCPAVIVGMPVEIVSTLARSLARDRVRRPATAQEFYRDLIGHGSTLPKRPQRTASSPGRFSLASFAIVALCALTLGLPAMRKWMASAGGVARTVTAATAPAAVSGQQATVPELAAMQEDSTPSSGAVAAQAPVVRQATGVVTFESRRIVAGAAQSLVAIPLRRLQSTRGRTSVAWEIERGSAQPDIDYEALKPQIARFNDGEAVRSLFIALTRRRISSTSRLPRTFSVALRQVVGGAQLGPVTRIDVTIAVFPMLSDISHDVAITRSPAN
jgi:hypothetical protein